MIFPVNQIEQHHRLQPPACDTTQDNFNLPWTVNTYWTKGPFDQISAVCDNPSKHPCIRDWDK